MSLNISISTYILLFKYEFGQIWSLAMPNRNSPLLLLLAKNILVQEKKSRVSKCDFHLFNFENS